MAKWKKNEVFMLITVLLVASVVTVLMLGAFNIIPMGFVAPTTDDDDVVTPSQYSINCLTKFTFRDQWYGGGIKSATVTLYDKNTLTQVDTGSTDATNGIFTSNIALTSGDTYYALIVLTNAYEYFELTIPYEDTDTATYHYVTLDFYTLGGYAITVDYQNGTAVNSNPSAGVSWDQSDASYAWRVYPTFTVMIRCNSTSDYGVGEYYDPFKAATREVTMIWKTSGAEYESLIIQNYDILYTASTARYFGFIVDPWALVIDKDAQGIYKQHNGQDLDGITTFNINMDCSGISATLTNIDINMTLSAYDNLAQFESYGNHYSDSDYQFLAEFNWCICNV